MHALSRLAAATVVASCGSGVARAQQSAAGSAVAEQLAQSSLRMIGSLVAVLALVALCSWALRRWRDRRSVDNESIEIVSGISLGAKERIVLLKVGDEQVLVGVSPAGMRSLHVVRQTISPEDKKIDAADADASAPTKTVPSTFSLSLGTAQ